jgi:hypothetical protein
LTFRKTLQSKSLKNYISPENFIERLAILTAYPHRLTISKVIDI